MVEWCRFIVGPCAVCKYGVGYVRGSRGIAEHVSKRCALRLWDAFFRLGVLNSDSRDSRLLQVCTLYKVLLKIPHKRLKVILILLYPRWVRQRVEGFET